MTTPNVPSIWSGGAEWGPAETAGASGYWLADDWNIGLTGRPHPFVAIAGKLVNGFGDDSVSLQSGSWDLGRRDWFDVLTSSTASFSFAGSVDAASGDLLVVSTESGVLWVGNVNGVTQTQQTDGSFVTTVSAVDAIGRLGQTVPPNGQLVVGPDTFEILYTGLEAASYGTEDVIRWFLDTFGAADVALTVGDSAGTLPTLTDWYEPPELTLLDVLNTIERTANAMMSLQPGGSLLITMRDYLTAASVVVVDLVDADAPYIWTVARSGVNVVNHWVLERPTYHHSTVLDEPSSGTPNATLTASIAVYGDRAYQVGDYLCTSSSHFTAGLKTAMAAERPVVTEGRFHVTDLSQRVLLLSPLSWVRQGDDTWQVMSVHHEFSGNTWDVSITADVSQSTMVGVADPTPDDPPATTTTDTQTLTSTKSATVVKSSGGSFMGNGAGDYLPVGYYDGFRHRALIDFTTLSWPAGFVRVKKATLNLRTSGQAWVTFGSKPKFYAKRITSSWSEGTFNAAAPSQYSSGNASVWPGPDKTSAGQTLKAIGTSENNDISIDVTDIMQAAHDAGDFDGIMLVSANEDSHTNCVEFYSDDHATSGFRPELVVTCEVI